MNEQERFKEIDRLFAAVQDLPIGDRAARLAELCDDEPLRREVLELFSFDSPTAIRGIERAMGRSLSASEAPSIDGIKLREVIGAGAMGVVYRAEQASPRREVAVKVMGAGLGTTLHSRRFRSEADALARLDHPGIARVFQAGVAEIGRVRRPYLVMELVEGERLDQWLERRTLPVRARLELMIEICEAVQHAHVRGVIHRDLKPSNILIRSEDGKPKVIDFGVARITDPEGAATMATAAGEMVGTLAYMSPEQLSGDPSSVDTRSDIYGLGVILFHLLCGEMPLEVTALSLTDAARAIQRDEPRRLASIDPSLRGDLDTIAAHSLEKDKERRYQTTEAMKVDVRRHLDGLPIGARPPSTMYLLSRLARRHRGPVAVGAVLTVALVAAGAIAARSALVARDALDESRRAQLRLENINTFLTEDLLEAGHTMNLGVNARIVDAIDLAQPKIAKRFADDPIGEASVRQTVGRMLAESARHEEALAQLDLAAEALEAGGFGEHREMIDTYCHRSVVLDLGGRLEESEHAARQALALVDRLGLPENDRQRTDAIASIGSSLQNQGRYEEAEPLLRRAVEQRRAAGDTKNLLSLYTQLYQITVVLTRDQERAEIMDRIIDLARGHDEPVSRILGTRFEAMKHMEEGNPERALDASLRGLDVARKSIDRGSPAYRYTLLQAADDYAELGRHDEAAELAVEAVELFARAVGEHHYEVERVTNFTASIYEEAGRTEEAIPWRLRQMTLRFYIAGPDELESLRDTARDGAELLGSGEAFFSRLIEEAESIPAGSDQRPAFLANVGRVLSERGDPRAEAMLAGSFESLDLGRPAQRPEDVIQRLVDSLPAHLERASRDEEATAWRRRLDEARASLPGASKKN